MYDEKTLGKYPYFEQLMKTMDRSSYIDSLTGLIARRYMMGFIRSLLEKEIPFTLAMIDLDNFKGINDRYGHRTGDEVLSTIARDLVTYVGDDAVIGRFGGDEFLIVYTLSNEYAKLHKFYDGMFFQYEDLPPRVFRRTLSLQGGEMYITATLGSASYPENASDFESLFAVMDKALYRGKSKGRNCFIIYVPEKHMYLDMNTLNMHSLFDTYYGMREIFETVQDMEEALPMAFSILSTSMGMHRLLWVAEGSLKDMTTNVIVPCEDVDDLIHNGMYSVMDCSELTKTHPRLSEYLKSINMRSFLLMEIGKDAEFGYIGLCPEAATYHIWQDAEHASGFVFACMLAAKLKDNSVEKIDFEQMMISINMPDHMKTYGLK